MDITKAQELNSITTRYEYLKRLQDAAHSSNDNNISIMTSGYIAGTSNIKDDIFRADIVRAIDEAIARFEAQIASF